MVKFWKKKTDWNRPFSERVAKRVSRIPTLDLTMWADQALYSLGAQLRAYENSRDSAHLAEVLEGAEAFHAVIFELNKRTSTIL